MKSNMEEPESLNRVLRWIISPFTKPGSRRGGTGLGEGRDDEFSLTNNEF
jgi:hypothetical protein